ncbi:hypothetical protein GKZ28_08505 [Clostridium chromiireducens]|jgi:hypothetical protein|uniref:Uncharacterized protein n=1 Tax=Clostridium chromiireducens TaxID=225345 RepID=A0A964RLP8_9CLOT|nr:hypothetical protein [Clostridium chromiireducens]MVX63735.1 hypothetical protein [Clostridium chromiireducens]
MKILLKKSIISIEELKELKLNNKVIYNPNEPNIDVVIDDTTLYFYNFKEYSIEYKHWINSTTLAFIVSTLEDTLAELNSMNF